MAGEVAQTQTQTQVAQQVAEPAPQPIDVASGPGVQQLRFALTAGRPPIPYVSNLMLSYPHERDDMMRLLQQTVGNGYVHELIEATPEFKGATGEPLSVDAYWKKYARQTLFQVQQRLMTEVQFDVSAPGVKLPSEERSDEILVINGSSVVRFWP